jgi:hypothetical protein
LNNGDPTFSWSDSGGNAWYNFELYQNGHPIKTGWYEKNQSALACENGTCTLEPEVYLTNANYSWQVQAWGPSGITDFSATQTFDLTLPAPPAPDVASFHTTNHITTDDRYYRWADVNGAMWYELYVGGDNGQVHQQWYRRVDICSGGTCSAHPQNFWLSNGSYQMWVRAWGPGGYSTGGAVAGWGGPYSFSLNEPTPTAPVLSAPLGSISDETPIFTWNSVPGATWYQVYVAGSTGPLHHQWHQMNCDTGTCTLDLNLVLAQGEYTVWLQAYGPGGIGPWNGGASFTVQ